MKKEEIINQIRGCNKSWYSLEDGWKDRFLPKIQETLSEIYAGLVNYGLSNENDRLRKELNEIVYKISNGIQKFGIEDFDYGYVILAPTSYPIIDILEMLEKETEDREKIEKYLSEIVKRVGGKIRIIATRSKSFAPTYLRRRLRECDIPLPIEFCSATFEEIKNNVFHYPKEDDGIIALEIEIRASDNKLKEKPYCNIVERIYRREF